MRIDDLSGYCNDSGKSDKLMIAWALVVVEVER